MKKILFVIPHPDDEIVGTCILIRKLLREKKKNIVSLFNKWCNFVLSKLVLEKK